MGSTKPKGRRDMSGHPIRGASKIKKLRVADNLAKPSTRRFTKQIPTQDQKQETQADGRATAAADNSVTEQSEQAVVLDLDLSTDLNAAEDEANRAADGAATSTDEISWPPTLQASPLLNDIMKWYDITPMHIISSSKIQKKATRALDVLSLYPAVPPAKVAIVVLHARANAASKLITIAEIAKREIAGKNGKWYQYNEVGQIFGERKTRNNSKTKAKIGTSVEDVSGAMDLDEEIEEDADTNDDTFETMKTPFERAIEGQPKVRAVPTMTIYLSRIRIDKLRKAYSEQTNGLETPTT